MRMPRAATGLWVLVLAVTLATTALSAVAFFAERMHKALSSESAAALAADLVVEQGKPIPSAWLDQAVERGLQTARVLAFPSVLFVAEQPQLVRVKAVEPGYPLRGRLAIENRAGEVSQMPPGEGEAVAEPRLARLLGSDRDAIQLGHRELQLSGRLVEEPDPSASLFQLAPRLLVSWVDAQQSGLLGPASRARYRLLLAGPPDAVQAYRDWLTPRLPAAARILTAADGRPEIDTAIERARRFLSLAALCASLLAGVAIMLAARSFLDSSLDEAAILRTLGMSSRALLRRHVGRLLSLGLVAALIGGTLGWLLQEALSRWLGGELGTVLPAAGWRPVPSTLGHAALLLLGFALPTLWSIRKVPPLRVLRRDLDPPGFSRFALILLALLAWMLLVYWQIQDLELAVYVGSALVAVALALASIAYLGIRLLNRLRAHLALPVGLLGIVRQPGLVVLQLSGFGLGLSLLLLLGIVRGDLIETWQRSLPADAPNHFLLNIQPSEELSLRRRLAQAGVADSGLFPTTRGRLVGINGQPVQSEDYTEPRARRLASREYNLGFGDRMQADNRLLAGHWWQAGEAGFSVEEDVARLLDLGVGDILVFDVAGQTVQAPILNLRSVQWDSFNVNFFVQGSEALLRAQAVPYAAITSIYLAEGSEGLLAELSREFPGVSAISIAPLLQKVRAIIERGGRAVEAVFLFTLAAALLVSVAALQLTRSQREREIALLRTLGSSRGQVRVALFTEFGSMGLIAGVIATLVANGMGLWFGWHFFGIRPDFGFGNWVLGPVGGAALLVTLAWLASRPLLSQPPLRSLR